MEVLYLSRRITLDIRILGKHKGKTIQSYILRNKNGMEIEVLNLGGIIKGINYKGKNRVLGYETYREYLEDENFFGAVIGPVYGIVSDGRFNLNGNIYDLDKNKGQHCLHSGEKNLSKKVWRLYETMYNGVYESFTLACRVEDEEDGFPGNRRFFVKYTLNDDNELILEYKAESDKETIVSLTSYNYFNLNDDLEDEVLNHSLKIDADRFIELDGDLPKGIENVEGTVFDFRKKKTIGRNFDLNDKNLRETNGFCHNYILNKGSGEKIELSYKDITVAIETTQPSVGFYTGNKLNKRMGICLNTGSFPDGINKEFLGMEILKPNKEYYNRTIYTFK